MNYSTIDTSRRIMITGGSSISPESCFLAHLIGFELINAGYNLVSNGAKGIDSAVAEGALMACLLADHDVHKRIKVFRPISHPLPDFDFGHLRIVGTNRVERRDFAIRQSNIVVVLGGGSGTLAVAAKCREMNTPLIAVGVGSSEEASVSIWHEFWSELEAQDDPVISREELTLIGPGQFDLRAIARAIIAISERILTR